jgi:predicted DNA-binding protein (MmcQ/YjbR family)
MLSHATLKALLGAKPGATAGYPFGPGALVFKVGGKVFAILAGSGRSPRVSLKCDPHLGEVMRRTYAAVTPGYHLDKRHWITIAQDADLPDAEVRKLAGHSYDRVVQGLPRTAREALAQGSPTARRS